MLISWARPLLASIAIALRSSDSGIPESTDDTGGFAISYNVKIVFSCPVDVACKDNKPAARRIGVARTIGVSRRGLTYKQTMGRKQGNTDPFMKDLGPLLGQSPVEQDRSRLLRGFIHSEVLVDHGAEDMRERTRLQLSCRALHAILPFTATEMRNKTKGTAPRDGEGARQRQGRKQQR